MKHKTEVAKILKNLCQLIKRQFENNVQGFKTDNAKDFYNNELQEFLNKREFDMKLLALIFLNRMG